MGLVRGVVTNRVREYLATRFAVDLIQPSPIRVPGFSRKHLALLFNSLDFHKGAEIGVDLGRHAFNLCKRISGLQLLCVDPYAPDRRNPRALEPDKYSGRFRRAQEKLAGYNVVWMRQMSMDAVREIDDESLDFVYIDGNHMFDYVMTDLIEWSKKVRLGGIVSGHDYYNFRNGGVVPAVDAYTKAHKIKEWFVLGEKSPSFLWAK